MPVGIDDNQYVQYRADLAKTSQYATTADYPWLDNVAIDWPGETLKCKVTGYFTKREDYGQIKLLVDGQELIKELEFDVTVYDTFHAGTCEARSTVEVQIKNTDKYRDTCIKSC